MDPHALLSAQDELLRAYDEQIRRHPSPDPGDSVERDERIVRVVTTRGGWAGITWSDLDDETADDVIRAQLERFADAPHSWEWKHYSYDRPAHLLDLLTNAGFVAQPPETLLVADLADLDLEAAPPPGVVLREVVDAAGVDELVRLHDRIFGGDHATIGTALIRTLDQPEPTTVAVLATARGLPVSAGRVEFATGTQFASLWGGGTLEDWRGRGIFRALVSRRAAMAAARGFRYLQVDATADSRPILRRLGFVELATTTPLVHPGRTR